MKRTRFDLSKHMPRHIGMKVLAVMLASVGLVGLWGSLKNANADLIIQSSIENAVATIQQLHITQDGTASTVDRVRLDSNGVYIEPSILGSQADGILKLNSSNYVIRDLVQGADIANNSITSAHIASGSILTGHLGFPYPAAVNNSINMSCPSGEVMEAIVNGLPVCTPVGTGSVDCGTGGVVQGWSSTGLVICGSMTGGTNPFSSAGGSYWHQPTGLNDIHYGTVIDSNGKVGVGITTPAAKLHIGGSFRVDTAGGSSFVVSGGRIGINTANPVANLDVNGLMRLSTYAGIGTRVLGVDTAGFVIATTGVVWMQTGGAIYTLVGNVGIGTNNPTEKLQVIGNVKANAYLTNSDARLKKNITPLSHMLDKIVALNPVSFIWNDSGKSDIGFIAQDVEKIFPDLVTTDSQGYKAVEYSNLVAPVVQAIKEIHENMQATAQTYQTNEQRIEKLEAQMRSLERQLGIK